MVPLTCNSHPKHISPVTGLLLAGILTVFAYQVMRPQLFSGFVPLDFIHSIFHPGMQTVEMVKLLCISFFLHGGLFHLISNMWYLWIFGNAVEYRMHSTIFLISYLVAGAVSVLVQAISDPYSQIPIVGASGAIAGIMGMHFVLVPFARILVWLPPFFILPVPSFIFLLVWVFIQYRGVAGAGAENIAWWAHLGGFFTGVLIALWLKRNNWISCKNRKNK